MPERTELQRPPDDLFTPVVDRWTEPFWQAAAEDRLVAPRCAACGTFQMPPWPFCPECRSQDKEWVTLSGRGTLYSYTVMHRAITPAMEGHVPFMVAVVSLPEAGGVRLISNLVDAAAEEVAIGDELEVVFDKRADGFCVPRFRPVKG